MSMSWRGILVFSAVVTLVGLGATQLCLREQVVGIEDNSDSDGLLDRELVLARVAEIAGVPTKLLQESTMELVRFAEDNTPFLNQQIINRPLWRVTVPRWRLQLPSALPPVVDKYERTFDVLVDPTTGNVLRIASRWPQDGSVRPPEISADRAEIQMVNSETYERFPKEAPAITFLQALDVVLREGTGNPLVARQICAHYVEQSWMGGSPRPVWAITLRGLHIERLAPPPLDESPHAERGVHVVRQMRNVVDAGTGQWLMAINLPNPFLESAGAFGEPGPDDLGAPTVSLELASPSGGSTVAPGEVVGWTITATVSTDDNEGLAMVVVDLLQGESNPELVEIPPGNAPPEMEDFDRPEGISNPTMGQYYHSAFGGTPPGSAGAPVLLQIGGAQNVFGAVGDGIGLDTQVDTGVGQSPAGQLIVRGGLLAPCSGGVYVFSLDTGLANVLEQVNAAPDFSFVRSAGVVYSNVQGGCGNCDEAHGGLGCSDPACEAIVCGMDPFCCNVAWDELCVGQALQHCGCDQTNSPFEFTVAGSPVCSLDISGPGGGAPDGKIGVNDFLTVLGDWNQVGVPADFMDPPGVGKEDMLLVLYYWGVCPCAQGTAPPPIEDEFEDEGLDWPEDWYTFLDCVDSGTPAQQESCACWLQHHLTGGGGDPDPDPTSGPFRQSVSVVPPGGGCPGNDPWGSSGAVAY